MEVPLSDFTPWEGKWITLTGEVVGKEIRSTARGDVLLVTVKPDAAAEGLSADSNGKVICYLDRDSQALLGSKVQVHGKLSAFSEATNPGQFSQAHYYQILKTDYRLLEAKILAAGRSHSRYRESLYRLKSAFGRTLDKYFEAENASILRTMLLGETGQTDSEIKELYQRNGIVHILAISGLHISLIGMSMYKLLRRIAVPIPIAAPVAVAVMVSFGEMTNISTSSLRAIVMFGLRMTAHLAGRTYDLLTALAVAAALILLEQPLYLNHSGFLFSFLAVLAISLFIPSMNNTLFRKAPSPASQLSSPPASQLSTPPVLKRLARPASQLSVWLKKTAEALLAGVCISAFTLPVYTYYYYQFPTYSLLLNLIVIPLMGVLMAAGILTMSVGLVFASAGRVTAVITMLILEFYKKLCLLGDSLPYHNLILGKPQVWQVVVYAGILIFLILFHRKLRTGIRYLVLTGGVLLLILRNSSGMSVTFLDVGQGDCIHIRSPAGRHYLIDAGSSDSQEVGRYRILPYLKSQGVRRLDALFITHPDGDHHSAFSEMIEWMNFDGIPIDALILPDIGAKSKNKEYLKLETMAAEAGIERFTIGSGQVISEPEMRLRCLHPESGSDWADSNAYSTVLLLEHGDFSLLLTGDVEGRGEETLNRYISGMSGEERAAIGNLTALKIAHHGSRNSTGRQFLQLTSPAFAVISAGYGNTYGHPHEELVERLKNAGTEVYITYKSGAVSIWTDGKKITISQYLPHGNEFSIP